jgi:hypothetical protein
MIRRGSRHSTIAGGLQTIRLAWGTTFLIPIARMAIPVTGSSTVGDTKRRQTSATCQKQIWARIIAAANAIRCSKRVHRGAHCENSKHQSGHEDQENQERKSRMRIARGLVIVLSRSWRSAGGERERAATSRCLSALESSQRFHGSQGLRCPAAPASPGMA